MCKVMVVDDSAFMRKYIKSIIVDIGCNVVAEASNGVEAIELCRKRMPDVITMDITMSEMDGVTALKEIRKFNKVVKIIMVSAMGQRSIIMDALSSGADDFIVKPIDKSKMVEVFKKTAFYVKM